MDPFAFVAAQGVTARIVEAGPFHLREPEYRAVATAAGATGAMLANLALDGTVFAPPIWEVSTNVYPFEDLKSDRGWNGIGPSVLWGVDSSWAVVVSDEGHGVVAGAASFVETVLCNLPSRGGELLDVVEGLYVRDSPHQEANERLQQMVDRLYGGAVTAEVFAQVRGQDT